MWLHFNPRSPNNIAEHTTMTYICVARPQWVNLPIPLQWRHNRRDSVSNHQAHDCLLKGLFRRRSKKTWSVTGLCVGTGEFPAQMASNADNVSIWWRHYAKCHHIMQQNTLIVWAINNCKKCIIWSFQTMFRLLSYFPSCPAEMPQP